MLESEKQQQREQTIDRGFVATTLDAWITTGPCQSPSGAFYAWVNEYRHAAYEYPEITGYALTYLSQRQTVSPEVFAHAQRAAHWLLCRFEKQKSSFRGEDGSRDIYDFDLAMIAMGLSFFWSQIHGETIIQQGLTLVSELQEEMMSDGGLCCLRGRAEERRPTWSIQGKAHLLAKLFSAF